MRSFRTLAQNGGGSITAITLAGVALAILGFIIARDLEYRAIDHEFASAAQDQVGNLGRVIQHGTSGLEAVAGLYEVVGEMDHRQFTGFAQRLLWRDYSIEAVEWIPRISADRRSAIEHSARGDGLGAFQIIERGRGGTLVPAGQRSEYFPVLYVEPYVENETALGLDLSLQPTYRAAMDAARDSGRAVASAPVMLTPDGSGHRGFFVFLPVYRPGQPVGTPETRRTNLAGFVLGIFRVGQLLEAAVGRDAEMDIAVFDTDAGGTRLLLYSVPPLPSAVVLD
ncbi:MAG: CHASE domain-containing protein, partial [Rhodospirillales bacterium]|nr:CHASE domain-containing protein [Rhodospirillales bacterium]